MTPHLKRALGDRHGETFSLGSFSDRTPQYLNGSNDGAAAWDMEEFAESNGYSEADHAFGYEDGDWGSDYAGMGYQFANLLVTEDKSRSGC
jgi:hypothetical protein